MRGLLYVALGIILLAALTPIKEQSTATSQSISLAKPEEDIVKLLILDVKQDNQVKKNLHFSTGIEVKVKVLNYAYPEKKDLLLVLRIRETTGDVIAAFSTLMYVPLGREKTYTAHLLVRSSGLMVVEASLHLSGGVVATDHYYIDITPFDLI